MAAKQQGKKKGKAGKRKQAQKNHRQARQKQRKLQSPKQKKPLSRQEHKAKAVSAGRLKTCSSKQFASKMLRQMPKVRMEAKARHLVKTMLIRLYKQVVAEVKSLEQKSGSSDVSCTDIKTALNDAIAKLLGKHTAKSTEATAGTTTAATATATAASSQCA